MRTAAPDDFVPDWCECCLKDADKLWLVPTGDDGCQEWRGACCLTTRQQRQVRETRED